MEKKIRILNIDINEKLNFYKIKVLIIEDEKEEVWGMTGDDFDNLVNQITKNNFSYSSEQRKILASKIKGLEFFNIKKVEIEKDQKIKDSDLSELQKRHDTLDKYPFYELQQEMLKENEN